MQCPKALPRRQVAFSNCALKWTHTEPEEKEELYEDMRRQDVYRIFTGLASDTNSDGQGRSNLVPALKPIHTPPNPTLRFSFDPECTPCKIRTSEAIVILRRGHRQQGL
ncbi:GL12552 [Drosophila persimilis]|uniref:GL12552 n=1 Tax=Drosophila persimilis TaxID=7234 RepID=B4GLE3_DROPE|nr:GL12552 [Drosophila persimilis]